MKNLLFVIAFLFAVGVVPVAVSAQQCDRSRMSPIRCGFYEEGYQDGLNDARGNAANDHRRYRSKFDNQYESFYQSGYNDGYASIRPTSRWTDRQKNTYDQGYDDGKTDRGRNISRLPARYEGQYDRSFEQYYRRGYFDGYDNRARQYDIPIDGTPPLGTGVGTGFPVGQPPRRIGTPTGVVNWSGRVDNRVNIVIKDDTVRTMMVAGPLSNESSNMQGVLPRRTSTLTAQRLDGRGTVLVLQQPTRANDFTGIVQIFDSKSGADNYSLRINWVSSSAPEPYSAGKVTWEGRVDGTVSVKVSGEYVTAYDETASGLSGMSYNMTGYLAARTGSVRVTKREGRGQVFVLEQPSAQNDYTAVIRIVDDRSSDDFYKIDIEW